MRLLACTTIVASVFVFLVTHLTKTAQAQFGFPGSSQPFPPPYMGAPGSPFARPLPPLPAPAYSPVRHPASSLFADLHNAPPLSPPVGWLRTPMGSNFGALRSPYSSYPHAPFANYNSAPKPASPARQCRSSGACKQIDHGTTLPTTWRVETTTILAPTTTRSAPTTTIAPRSYPRPTTTTPAVAETNRYPTTRSRVVFASNRLDEEESTTPPTAAAEIMSTTSTTEMTTTTTRNEMEWSATTV